MKRNNQSGTVLVVALLVFVLIEIALVIIIEVHGFELIHTKDLQSYHHKTQQMLGAESVAMASLVKVFDEPTLVNEPIRYETADGYLTIKLKDLQSLYNTNASTLNQSFHAKRLFEVLELSPRDVEILEEALKLNRSAPQLVNSEKQQTATNQQNPLIRSFQVLPQATQLSQPAEPLLVSVTEILPMVSVESFIKLLPFITALPEPVGLNMNTASKPVLMTLSENMTESLAEEIIQLRGSLGTIENIEQLNENEAIKALQLSEKLITFKSQYFRADISLIQDGQAIKLYTWFKVVNNDDYTDVQLLSRSFGSL